MSVTKEQLRQALIAIIGNEPSVEQWLAIEAPLAPGLIVAGAGTGKTTVMAARIAWLIMSGQITPDRILGLTFTTKATSEFQSRVRKYLPGATKFAIESGINQADELGEPTILTYNSFGSRLLKEHALRLGLEPDARVVVDASRYQLAMRVVANTKMDLAAYGYSAIDVTKDLLQLDEKLANYLIEPDALIQSDLKTLAMLRTVQKRQKLTDAMELNSQKRQALANLVKDFRQAKIDADIYDYSDQIRLAAKAALNSTTMQEMLREQFGVVLLDEYQDTSVGQKVLLQALFGNGHPVTAVGDPCQAIYGWRGAEITNMDSFPEDFPVSTEPFQSAAIYKLTGNRRSGENILTAANLLSSQLRQIHPIISPLSVANEQLPAGNIKVGLLNTFADEVNWVADQVAELDLKNNWGDVAVLIRNKKNIGEFVQALEEREIPVQVADAGDLVDLPEVRDLVSYLEIIADPTANTALARILTGPRFAIGARDLALLGRAANELVDLPDDESFATRLDLVSAQVDRVERACLLDALELVATSEVSYSSEARERMSLLATELRELRRHAGEPVPELINRLVRTTGIGVQTLINHHGHHTTGFDRIAALLDLAGSYVSIDGEMSLRAFVTFLKDAERFDQQATADISTVDNAVTVMTIHKSKGLEFPIVVMPTITNEVFPSSVKLTHWPKSPTEIPLELKPKNLYSKVPMFPLENNPRGTDYEKFKDGAGQDRTIDERRLAYVAVTRAEHTLIASSSWWGPTQKKLRGPSDFLVELNKHATQEGVWEAQPDSEATNPVFESENGVPWPVDPGKEIRPKLLLAKALVENTKSDQTTELTESDLELISQWDADLLAITADFDLINQAERIVKLPSNLSASQIMNLKKDQEAFLKSLVRPMPRQPSATATRGTNFHAWVEEFFKKRALIDPESLPGAGDADIYTDAQLEQLKAKFKDGIFAERSPDDLEVAFSILVNGRTWIGRMDAVFAGNVENPKAQGWLVVDWKTGKVGSADELQLSIYRHALAELKHCDPNLVQAVFYYVTEGTVVMPEKLLSRQELEDLI